MKNISSLIAWVVAAIMAGLALLNWSTLMVMAPLDLVVAQIQAPLGVVMLGLVGVVVALFFVAYLRNQIGSLLETRKLVKEVQRVQDLADKAEASRIQGLQQLVTNEFRLLNERLSLLLDGEKLQDKVPQDQRKEPEFRPVSLTEIFTGHERA